MRNPGSAQTKRPVIAHPATDDEMEPGFERAAFLGVEPAFTQTLGHGDHSFLDDIEGIVVGEPRAKGDAVQELPVGVEEGAPALLIVPVPQSAQQAVPRGQKLIRRPIWSRAFHKEVIAGVAAIFHTRGKTSSSAGQKTVIGDCASGRVQRGAPPGVRSRQVRKRVRLPERQVLGPAVVRPSAVRSEVSEPAMATLRDFHAFCASLTQKAPARWGRASQNRVSDVLPVQEFAKAANTRRPCPMGSGTSQALSLCIQAVVNDGIVQTELVSGRSPERRCACGRFVIQGTWTL